MKAPQAAAASISLLLFYGCGGNQAALNSAAVQGAEIAQEWWLIFWIILAVFVFVLICLFFALQNRASSTNPIEIAPDLDQRFDSNLSLWVGGALSVTVLLLFVILVSSIVTGHRVSNPEANPAASIKVIGHQWWWEIRYEDPDPSKLVITANEIHLPVGESSVIKTESVDVIHSFWVPNLTGKRDLVPGYEGQLWIHPFREGTYRGQCAEFCGLQHAHMALLVVVESYDKYRRWLETQRTPALSPRDANTKLGLQIFTSRQCAMCHAISGSDAGARFGPDLTHLARRQSLAAGTLKNNRGNLAGWILDPQSVKPGNSMPPNPLNTNELNALLDYLDSLK